LLGGYSAIWLARAIGPKGKLVTLELDENHVRVAGKNLERAGLRSLVEIRQGAAAATLEKMVQAGEAAFDLVFIDADKNNYPVYLDYAMKLTHPGSLILGDNVIRDGKVARSGQTDPLVLGIQEFNRKLAANPKLETILITVMREALDGLAIARVKD
jgi:predicted O-methyltransferase YrrM